MDTLLTPCLFLNLFSHPVPSLKELESVYGYSNGNNCCAFAIRSGPLTGVPIIIQYALQFKTQLIRLHLQHFCKLAMLLQTLHRCWTNPRYTALCSSLNSGLLTIFLFLMQSPYSISVTNCFSLTSFLVMS